MRRKLINTIKNPFKTLFLIGFSLLSSGIFNQNPVWADNNLNYDVEISSGIRITLPSSTVSLDVNPATSSLASKDFTVTVDTNNPTGYTLTMTTNNTTLSLSGGSDTIETLPTKSGGYTDAQFVVNKWGYKLGSGNYFPFASSVEVNTTSTPASGSTNTVTFAAKADTTKTSGSYATTINFVAVTNVPPAPTMQDLDPSLCVTSAPTTVIDSRDGEEYKVQRLADGECWLLDNLRLNLTNSTILNSISSANTNIDSATEAATLKSLKEGNRSAGEQYADGPFTAWDSSHTDDYYTRASVNVASKDNTTTSYGSGSGKIGVYYNYCAATAGSYCYDDEEYVVDATQDICPKGWRIPTGGSSGEYQALYTAYSGNVADFLNALSTPSSGYFSEGLARAQGDYGWFWSATYDDDFGIYRLSTSSSDIGQADSGTGRDYGLPVRCLLK